MPPEPGSPLRLTTKPVGGGIPSLSLRRRSGTRSPFELSEASAAARKQIASIVSATRSPFGTPKQLNTDQVGTLERTLRELEMKLVEREHAIEDLEGRLAERERDIAEAEALIAAREKLLEATRRSTPAKVALSKEEQAALEQLKTELDRQEASLKEQKASIAERERFLEDNEGKLYEKMMQQQEKETEIEQREEDLKAREKRLRKSGGESPADAADQAAAAKKFDEFNE